jgi:hypothetical protein
MAYTGTSIVDYLTGLGQDSSFNARRKLAEKYKIGGYTGTADQNLKLLGMLRNPAPAVKDVPVLADKPVLKAEAKPEVKPDTVNPILDPNGNAYVITPGGFSTVGKGANGSYMLGSGDRYATQEEADKIKSAMSSGQPITPDMLQGISGKPAAGGTNFFDMAWDKLNPVRQKINDLLAGIFGDMSKPYNSATDPDYQMYRADMLKQADTAYSNINADYLGNQGGNFNSAAQQIASSAKNDLVNKANLAAADFEDRFNANQRNKMSDSMALVNQLLGIDEANTAAQDKAFQKQLDTIDQYYNDFTAEINRRTAADPNDPLIPYLKIAVQNKIAAQAAAKTEAGKQAYKDAMDAYKINGVITTDEQARILGIPKGTKTADYSVDMMNANTSRMNAETSQKNADKSAADKSTLTNTQIFNQAKDMLAAQVPKGTGETDNEGKPAMRPKYTREQFEDWLYDVLPETEEGKQTFNDIMAALDIDHAKFYEPVFIQKQRSLIE